MGYETNENNRSLRFNELISQYHKITYEDFKKIKYDLQLPRQLAYTTNSDTLFMLHPEDDPEVASLITLLNNWDRKTTIDSKGAAIFGIVYYQVIAEQAKGAAYRSLSKNKSLELLRWTKNYTIKNFGSTEITLGQYQKLVRGTKELPLEGLPDVISSMSSVPYRNGIVKGQQGESYIELVKFTREGPVIETVNCFGASNNPGDPHFADQMDMFIHQKTKPMTLNKELIYQQAKRLYHPK